uniref:Origin recognition complex subunit 1 n=1 Tax=Gasterosteus aculeatus aculeatus TaxID=481459 RepID=A0AAQ4PM89_GASAC
RMKYFTRLRVRRVYEWRGKPLSFNRKLKTYEYGVEGLPRITVIKIGQHILIEGEDEDNPYVAKVIRLFGDDSGKQKKAVVQWFVRVFEVPLSKLKLLGREPHPQEIFYYQGRSCDDEVDAGSILKPVQVTHLDAAAPFPDAGDGDALYVKLSWDSKTFRVAERSVVESELAPASSPPPRPTPSLPPSPPCSPPAAALASRGPARRALPTPDLTVMRRAAQGEARGGRATASAGKARAAEAESLHSSTKLSASKCLSAKRRNASARTPGVRKKLELSRQTRCCRASYSSLEAEDPLLDQNAAKNSQQEGEVLATRVCDRNGSSSAFPASPSFKCSLFGQITPGTPRTPQCATPSIPSRSLPARQPANVLEEARTRLHVSSVPESLPCREQEFQDIYSFVESKIEDGTGGCMYISGVPGTGKTATVQEVMRCLQHAADVDEIPPFHFIEINGMKMTDPHQAYVQILQKLTGQKATADHAAALLEKRFSNPAPRKETTVLLVDELDLLWTRKQNVMYNLFDWPTRRHARLVVLTIANTMDLPERIMINRVASRLGLTRMSFQPYSFKQLQQIIMSRLNKVKAFEEDALQLVWAALSGDARRCLDICRTATEICEHSPADPSATGLVEVGHVMEALNEMFSSAYVTAIKCASLQEQLFLRAVIAEFRRLGLEEATFQQVFVQHQALCRVEGLQPISVSEGLAVCRRLGGCRLLLLEPSRLGVLQRVRLNVSQDDVLYALKAD